MRITGGICRGGRLLSPAGLGLRPTSDKVRQALFNLLRDRVAGSVFLDLFAGVGSVGIEALSREASSVDFVEKSPQHARYIERNLQRHRLSDRGRIFQVDALAFLARPPRRPNGYDLIFLDPPYRSELLKKALRKVASGDIIKPGGWVIVEHHRQQDPTAEVEGFTRVQERRYGETVLSFFAKAQ